MYEHAADALGGRELGRLEDGDEVKLVHSWTTLKRVKGPSFAAIVLGLEKVLLPPVVLSELVVFAHEAPGLDVARTSPSAGKTGRALRELFSTLKIPLVKYWDNHCAIGSWVEAGS